MSEQKSESTWLDRHWYWLVITLGVICVYFLDTFAPTW